MAIILETAPEDLLGPLNEVEKKHAPATLFLAGDASLLRRGPRVSVIGSRQATKDGIARTQSLVRALVKRGMVVVSGLAEGVDTAAHETAVSAGGKTIAVVGTPLNAYFPPKNRALQDFLMREHLVVSQFPSGTSIDSKCFPLRNQTMALLSDASIVVEAGERSGTRHQCWEALRLGRLLFLMENVATNRSLSWPAQIIQYGAQVLSRENLDLVLEEMPEIHSGEPAPF